MTQKEQKERSRQKRERGKKEKKTDRQIGTRQKGGVGSKSRQNCLSKIESNISSLDKNWSHSVDLSDAFDAVNLTTNLAHDCFFLTHMINERQAME